MKRISAILLTFAVLLSFSGIVAASGNTTIVDDVLYIYQTSSEPTIDGELDDVWMTATAVPLLLFEGASEDSIASFDDHYTTYRVMWDEDNFYFFGEVVDNEVSNDLPAEPWNNDCFELFFDGGNEKASSYDTNDVQWRWVYGDVPGDTANNIGNGVGTYAFKQTPSGWNIELKISQEELINGDMQLFPLEVDAEIGFEVSNADRDNGAREDVLHWWTTDGNTWQDASLFGTAVLVNRELDDVMLIHRTDEVPVIDALFDEEEGWGYANEISMLKLEGDPAPIPDTLFANWKDHMTNFYTMWDHNSLYFYVKVIDQEKSNSIPAEPWNNDCIEMFFDGGNEKASSYDTNDVQWRWVYGDVPGDTANNIGNGPGWFKFRDTEIGYDFELVLQKSDLVNGDLPLFDLTYDTEIGFEISNADRDNETRETVKHWWTNDGNTWQDASLFGTAVLVENSEFSDIEFEELDTPVPTDFTLYQNYPNPFNPSTTIKFALNESSHVTLEVYDIVGRKIAEVVNKDMTAGTYSLNFDGSKLASGVYMYKLNTNNHTQVRKMVLLK